MQWCCCESLPPTWLHWGFQIIQEVHWTSQFSQLLIDFIPTQTRPTVWTFPPEQLQLSALCDDQLLGGSSALRAQLSHLLHHAHPVPNVAERHVFEVQMFSFLERYEELRVVGVPPTVRHRQDARPRVPDVEVFVLECGAVDGFAPGAVTFGDVASLKRQEVEDWSSLWI